MLNNIAISGTLKNEDSNTAISFNEKEIVKVFPNPKQDYINIVTSTLGKSSVAIYSALGKTMYQSTFTNALKVDFTSFATGIYFVGTRLPNEKPFVQKVVKY